MIDHLTTNDLVDVLAGQSTGIARDHLLECPQCATEVAGIQFVSAFPTAIPERLRCEVVQIAAEESSARKLTALLEPGAFDPDAIMASPAAHSATFVQNLLEASVTRRETEPASALELVDTALSLAGELPSGSEESAPLLLQANCWRERANALRYLGRYEEALRSLDRGHALLADVPVSGYEEARIELGRAMVLAKLQRLDAAAEHAAIARSLFEEYGDRERLCDTDLVFGMIAFEKHEHAEAREIFARALELARQVDDPARIAMAENNVGAAEQELGSTTSAAEHFRSASALYELLGMTIERARTEWSLALLSLSLGRNTDAIGRLRSAGEAFTRCGSHADGALIAIDLAEVHLQLGDRLAADRALAAIPSEHLSLHAATAVGVLRRQLDHASRELFADTRTQLMLPANR